LKTTKQTSPVPCFGNGFKKDMDKLLQAAIFSDKLGQTFLCVKNYAQIDKLETSIKPAILNRKGSVYFIENSPFATTCV
jgi:hypothetical protein